VPEARYTAVAIALHWVIAAAIVGNFALGLWMHEAIDAAQHPSRVVEAYQVHKSLGLTVLILSLFRLAWRLLHRPPPLPNSLSAGQKFIAGATHWLFYALMIALPLSGWLYVSTQWRDGAPLNVPTLWFGLFEVPHLLGLDQATLDARQDLAAVTGETHELLAFGTMGLLLLHVGAALKHQFVDRDGILGRILPALPRATGTTPARRWLIPGALVTVLAALAALVSLVLSPNDGSWTDGVHITATAEGWIIDPDNSEIAFEGVHAGKRFRGHFCSSGQTTRPLRALALSSIQARPPTACACTTEPCRSLNGLTCKTTRPPVSTPRRSQRSARINTGSRAFSPSRTMRSTSPICCSACSRTAPPSLARSSSTGPTQTSAWNPTPRANGYRAGSRWR